MSDRKPCTLVMVEWLDSAQPEPRWSYLSKFREQPPIRCASVGWLVQDDDTIKVLAPNMGDVDSESSMQVSGLIRIPACCVVKITQIREPDLKTSLGPDPSSRPEKGRTRRAG